MPLRLLRASPSDRETLASLWQLYCHDFSELLPLEVDARGRFEEPRLDAYFSDARREAYLLAVDDKLAGFALVHSVGEPPVWDMAEFFVLRRHRRAGLGSAAARQLFDSHPGQWRVRQREANVKATAFWRRVIGDYTGGGFEERAILDPLWRGVVQGFRSGE